MYENMCIKRGKSLILSAPFKQSVNTTVDQQCNINACGRTMLKSHIYFRQRLSKGPHLLCTDLHNLTTTDQRSMRLIQSTSGRSKDIIHPMNNNWWNAEFQNQSLFVPEINDGIRIVQQIQTNHSFRQPCVIKVRNITRNNVMFEIQLQMNEIPNCFFQTAIRRQL